MVNRNSCGQSLACLYATNQTCLDSYIDVKWRQREIKRRSCDRCGFPLIVTSFFNLAVVNPLYRLISGKQFNSSTIVPQLCMHSIKHKIVYCAMSRISVHSTLCKTKFPACFFGVFSFYAFGAKNLFGQRIIFIPYQYNRSQATSRAEEVIFHF